MGINTDTRRRLPRHLADWPGTYHFDDHPEVGGGTCRVLDISRMGAGVVVFGNTPVDPLGQDRSTVPLSAERADS